MNTTNAESERKPISGVIPKKWEDVFPPAAGWVRCDMTLKTEEIQEEEDLRGFAMMISGPSAEIGCAQQRGKRLVMIVRKAPAANQEPARVGS